MFSRGGVLRLLPLVLITAWFLTHHVNTTKKNIVCVTFTPKIKSAVTGQAPITPEWKNFLWKKMSPENHKSGTQI